MSFRNPSQFSLDRNTYNQSNFNQSYNNIQNVIPQRDIKNYNNVLHNNINDPIVSEIVTEYTLHIDSNDRDTTLYPNPYKFSVSLGGSGSQTVKTTSRDGLITTTTSYSGSPNPKIDIQFKNLKYVKIKYLMLPRTILYKRTDSSGVEYSVPSLVNDGISGTILANYRYLILKIKELDDDKLYSTNDIIRNNCFVLYRDSNYHDAINDLWIATQPVRIYYDNLLKNNLNKLTFEIMTPTGDEFRLKYYDPAATNTKININYSEINNLTVNNNFYTDFTPIIQMSMEIEFGVCENQINTQKNYKT